VASFEDVTTVLDQRIEADGAGTEESAKGSSQQSDDDIEKPCATSPAARPWCVRSTICSSVPSSCVPATSTSRPFRTGLVVRFRVDGLLRAIPSPSGISAASLDLAREDSRGG